MICNECQGTMREVRRHRWGRHCLIIQCLQCGLEERAVV